MRTYVEVMSCCILCQSLGPNYMQENTLVPKYFCIRKLQAIDDPREMYCEDFAIDRGFLTANRNPGKQE